MTDTNDNNNDWDETQRRLNALLKKFRPEEKRENNINPDNKETEDPACGIEGAEDLCELRKCKYCGRLDQDALMARECMDEDICADCKNDLMQYQDQLMKAGNEVVCNIRYMFGIPWNKRVKIRKISRKGIRAFVRGRFYSVKKWMANRGKEEGRIEGWKTEILENVVWIKNRKKVCKLKICMGIPAGTVAAGIVYVVISDYLRRSACGKTLNEEKITGLAEWYMVYYLYNMDYARYGKYYDHRIENHIYHAIKDIKRPENSENISLEWGIRQVKKMDKFPD